MTGVTGASGVTGVTGPLVKICGITCVEDAVAAVALGAGAIGFIFWPKSPRYIEPAAALEIVRVLPAFVTPNVLALLQEKFGLQPIGKDGAADVGAVMAVA